MDKCSIVIPVYKKKSLEMEVLSLKQCVKVLGRYPIIFVCPASLPVDYYQSFAQQNHCNISFERFPDWYFTATSNYSKLLLTKDFYKRFADYEFILIYQLDAWVFEDKLEYWCEQDYDYIGAPWFEGFDLATKDSPMLPIAGNGGFSLRKVSAILKVLNTFYREPKSLRRIIAEGADNGVIAKSFNFPLSLFKFIFHKERFRPLWATTLLSEDRAIARHAQKACKDFKLAPPDVARRFSFEAQPRRLYEMNGKKLPFGCHAFEKHDFEFWKEFIMKEGGERARHIRYCASIQ
ncbi:MAG: hypothetical protein C4548_02170 [Desulfobacteraceae bacterium]|nr:MAG: hypothetical protein C4548_02170 [Desulfobacteraceae bacterium]